MVWFPVGTGFSEEISAFSPEDLYSNLLGAGLAINVILQGHVDSVDEYNQAMESALKQVLVKLTVAPRNETEAMFRKLVATGGTASGECRINSRCLNGTMR